MYPSAYSRKIQASPPKNIRMGPPIAPKDCKVAKTLPTATSPMEACLAAAMEPVVMPDVPNPATAKPAPAAVVAVADVTEKDMVDSSLILSTMGWDESPDLS
jgi:hypothetical protein